MYFGGANFIMLYAIFKFSLWLISLVFFMQVVAIRDIIPPPQRETFNDVYIAYELMDTDLHQIIRSNQALSEEHCQVPIKSFLKFFIL